jgi:hypothetical protein
MPEPTSAARRSSAAPPRSRKKSSPAAWDSGFELALYDVRDPGFYHGVGRKLELVICGESVPESGGVCSRGEWGRLLASQAEDPSLLACQTSRVGLAMEDVVACRIRVFSGLGAFLVEWHACWYVSGPFGLGEGTADLRAKLG